LATRLKNLSERLARDVAQVYKESAFDFEPRWFAMIYALKDGEELAVTEISVMLGQTHPAVNRSECTGQKRTCGRAERRFRSTKKTFKAIA